MEKDKLDPEHHEIGGEKTQNVVTALVNSSDRHAVLKTVLERHPVSSSSKGAFRLYAICVLVYLCSTMNGE